ncbi:hypothetical protein LZS96_15285 [Vibrio fluvialis]|nr:hypothetical protein [Vibrio fluvialis]
MFVVCGGIGIALLPP